jgi:hypothetical protein
MAGNVTSLLHRLGNEWPASVTNVSNPFPVVRKAMLDGEFSPFAKTSTLYPGGTKMSSPLPGSKKTSSPGHWALLAVVELVP